MKKCVSPGRLLSLIVLGLVMPILSGCHHNVVVPAGYIQFAPPDNSFTCQAPMGWQSSAYGTDGGTSAGGAFTSGDATIKIDSSLGGSLMGDVAQSNLNQSANAASDAGAPPPPTVPAVEQLHKQNGQALAAELQGYQEMPMQTISGPYGPARLSEYTANGNAIHGYRATMLGNDREITIRAECSGTEWPALQASFLHVIESVAAGKTQ